MPTYSQLKCKTKFQWNLNIKYKEDHYNKKMHSTMLFAKCQLFSSLDMWTNAEIMLCTAQLGGAVLKAFGRVQYTPFQLAAKSPMITGQHTAGGSVSQLSQLAKLSPWLTLSTKDITTSFWHYNKWFWFLYNQIMGLYHFSNPIE